MAHLNAKYKFFSLFKIKELLKLCCSPNQILIIVPSLAIRGSLGMNILFEISYIQIKPYGTVNFKCSWKH